MLGELNPCGGGDPIPLLKPRLIIGRQPSCDITLRFPNVSSRHCEISLLNGYWYVRDIGSRNGIKVNGIRCDAHWLMPGDVISVSKHRYEVNYTPNGEAPPPMAEPDPLSISLLEKAGLNRHGSSQSSQFPRPPAERRHSAPPRHTLDSGRLPDPDDDDDDLDDDKLVWLDK